MEIFTIAFVVSSYQSRIIGPANGVDFEFLKKTGDHFNKVNGRNDD